MCREAYSFARTACSFFGSIKSMAPDSSKIGYVLHTLAAGTEHKESFSTGIETAAAQKHRHC